MGLKESGLRGSLRNVSVGIAAIPDTVVNRALFDEGFGTTFNDSVGDANGELFNGGTWTTDSRFEGDTAPVFDGSSEDAIWSPRADAPITWTLRVKHGEGLQSGANTIFGYSNQPQLSFNTTVDEHRFLTQNADEVLAVTESTSTVEGSYRIYGCRLDESEVSLRVYDDSDLSLIGTDTASNPTVGFDTADCRIANDEDGGDNHWSESVDLFDVHNEFVEDIDDLILEVYG